MSDPAIWIVLATTIAGCYISAVAGALRTFSRSRLSEWLTERGRAEMLEPFVDAVPRLVLICGSLRAAMHLVLLLATLFWLENQFSPEAVDARLQTAGLALLVAGLLISVFGVAIPTSWARYAGEPLLAHSLSWLMPALTIFRPFTALLHLFDPLVRRISGSEERENSENPLTEEILSVVEEHESAQPVGQDQKDMLEAVIELPSTTVEHIMTPRTEMTSIEVSSNLDQIKQVIRDAGHSRIPVYEESADNILGMLYAKDLIQFVGDGHAFDLRTVLRDALMVPESKSVRELLADFKARKVHIAIVLDEFGGTAGLVTIEDVVEEIIGDIEDEYEPEEDKPSIRQVSEDTYEIDARVYVDDLNADMDLDLPEDEDYDTVGGFVFSKLGHIPEVGETLAFDHFELTVLEAEKNRVKRVRLVDRNPQKQLAATNGKA